MLEGESRDTRLIPPYFHPIHRQRTSITKSGYLKIKIVDLNRNHITIQNLTDDMQLNLFQIVGKTSNFSSSEFVPSMTDSFVISRWPCILQRGTQITTMACASPKPIATSLFWKWENNVWRITRKSWRDFPYWMCWWCYLSFKKLSSVTRESYSRSTN